MKHLGTSRACGASSPDTRPTSAAARSDSGRSRRPLHVHWADFLPERVTRTGRGGDDHRGHAMQWPSDERERFVRCRGAVPAGSWACPMIPVPASTRVWLCAGVGHCERRGYARPGLARALLAPRIYRHEALPMGPTWHTVGRMLAASRHRRRGRPGGLPEVGPQK